MTIQYTGKQNSQLQCQVCHVSLEIRLAHGRKSGKPFLMVICPKDGRHFRGFISDRAYVDEVLQRLETMK